MKRHSPSVERNRDPIAAILAEELPLTGDVLEIASGTGEHAVHFARAFPNINWQPTDPDQQALDSIAAWREDAREDGAAGGALANLLPPVRLDAQEDDWPIARADAVVCINMLHISPVEAARGLMAGAARVLGAGSALILYGPYLEAEVPTAPTNLALDRSLKERDPRWGLRDRAWVDEIAAASGFTRSRRVAMPANNLMLVYHKS